MKRALLLLATTVITALLAVGIASADPVNSEKVLISTFDCGGEPVTVTFLLNPSSVFNVVDTTGNFVLTRVEGTETITDPETGVVLDEFEYEFPIGQGQREGLQGSLTTCDTTITIMDPEVGRITGDFTFTGFFTPRRG
jgi:hypothetical protein